MLQMEITGANELWNIQCREVGECSGIFISYKNDAVFTFEQFDIFLNDNLNGFINFPNS